MESSNTFQNIFYKNIKELKNFEENGIEIDEYSDDISSITNILDNISKKINYWEKISKKDLENIIKILENIKTNLDNNWNFWESNNIKSYINNFKEILKNIENTQKNIIQKTHEKVKKLKENNYSLKEAKDFYKKIWATKENIKEIQKKLWFNWKNLDWIFWPKTFKAIIKYQKKEWLTPNWIVWNNTIKKLFSINITSDNFYWNKKEKTKNTIKNLKENNDFLSPSWKKILNLMIPENSIDRDTENWWSWEIEKTSSLWESSQVKFILNEILNSDQKVLNFFKQIPKFQNTKTISDLEKQTKKLWNKKLISILERYIEPSLWITLASLLENWPKENLKIIMKNAKKEKLAQEERLKKIKKNIDKIQKEIKENVNKEFQKKFEQKWRFYYTKIEANSQNKSVEIKIPVEQKEIILEKIANDAIIQNKWNLIALFDSRKWFQWIWTNISLEKIINTLNLWNQLEKFFNKIWSSISILKLNWESPSISINIAWWNIVAIPLNKNTIFDINANLNNNWIWADTWIKYKSWEKIYWASIWASLDKSWNFIIWPSISFWVDLNQKIINIKNNIRKDFLVAIENIKNWQTYKTENFKFIKENDYIKLKEFFNIIKQENSTKNQKAKNLDSIIESEVTKKLNNELVWLHFSGANISILDPHIAIISFIASLTTWTELIYKWEKEIPIDEQEKYSKPIEKKFENKKELREYLNQYWIKLEDWYLAIPNNFEIKWDDSLSLKKQNWFQIISWDIKNIKIEKIIWEWKETNFSKVQMLNSPETEVEVKYRLVLNNWNEKIRKTNQIGKANIIPEKNISWEIKEKYDILENVNPEFIQYLKNYEYINNLDIKSFRNKEFKNLWENLVKWNSNEILSNQTNQLEKITWIGIDKLNYDEKLYLIDYLSSLASKYIRSEEFLKKPTKLKKFEEKYNYEKLFNKINANYLWLENFNNLHNNLIQNFNNSKEIKSEYVNWFWFVFRSPLDQDWKTPIFQWLWIFNKTINIIKTWENWKDSAIEINNPENKLKLIEQMSDSQLLEFKKAFNIEQNLTEIKNILKEKIKNGEKIFSAFLTKDIWLDDVIIIEIEKNTKIIQNNYKIQESTLITWTTTSKNLNSFFLFWNLTHIKRKKEKETPPPPEEETKKPEKPEPPKKPEKPEKPEPKEKQWEKKLDWDESKMIYEDFWYNEDWWRTNPKKPEILNYIDNIFEKANWKEVNFTLKINWNSEYSFVAKNKQEYFTKVWEKDLELIWEHQIWKTYGVLKYKYIIPIPKEVWETYNKQFNQYKILEQQYEKLNKQYNEIIRKYNEINNLINKNPKINEHTKNIIKKYNNLLNNYRKKLNEYNKNYKENINFYMKNIFN